MARVIWFETAMFDPAQEAPNPVNPIAGQSVLLWLREQSKGVMEMSEPDTEDWGWYSETTWNGRGYWIGASQADDEPEGGTRRWAVQIEKHRTLLEQTLGRAKMTADDPCAAHVQRLLEGEPGITIVENES